MNGNLSLGSRVAELVKPFASQGPVPAAGAAAACSVALGSALAIMTIRHAERKLAPRADRQLQETRTYLEHLIAEATRALDEDCAAVGELMDAAREHDGIAADVGSAADHRLQRAIRRATAVPLVILELARDAMSALESVANALSPTLASEVITAAGLLYTGAESAVTVVRQNVRDIGDQTVKDDIRERASAAMAGARQSHARICAATDEPD